MLYDGFEFVTINLFDKKIKQTSEEAYKKFYDLSYNAFIEQMCIPNPLEMFENKNNTFTFYISCKEDNDKIILSENFDYIFLRSMFFKNCFKKIRYDLTLYYNPFNINVIYFYKTYDFIFIVLNLI